MSLFNTHPSLGLLHPPVTPGKHQPLGASEADHPSGVSYLGTGTTCFTETATLQFLVSRFRLCFSSSLTFLRQLLLIVGTNSSFIFHAIKPPSSLYPSTNLSFPVTCFLLYIHLHGLRLHFLSRVPVRVNHVAIVESSKELAEQNLWILAILSKSIKISFS